MSAVPASLVCQRIREQVSLELDGELSQLERRMLSSHLSRCADCGTYADEVTMFTDALRSAPLEALERPVVLRRPRRHVAARLQVGVAAALAFAAFGLGSQLATSGSQSPSLSRFDRTPNLSPPPSVLEKEQAILNVVRPGLTLPPPGSVL